VWKTLHDSLTTVRCDDGDSFALNILAL